MYIGPWQEYNLSKRTPKSGVDSSLKPDIEKALMSSLDPEAARIALAAMKPYFDAPRPTRPKENQMQHQMNGRSFHRRHTNKLPPVHASQHSNLVMSARSSGEGDHQRLTDNGASPLSVRSVQSEPIRYSDSIDSTPSTPIMKEPRGRLPTLSSGLSSMGSTSIASTATKAGPPPSLRASQQNYNHVYHTHRQPPYDSPAMLNFLRLERNSRARSKIAQLTGWKAQQDSFNGTATKQQKLQPSAATFVSLSDRKVAQVKSMKHVYMSGSTKATVRNGESNEISVAVHLPPLRNMSNSTVGESDMYETGSDTRSINSGNGGMQLTVKNLTNHNAALATNQNLLDGGGGGGGLTAISSHQNHTKSAKINDVELDDDAFGLVSKYFQVENNGISGTSHHYNDSSIGSDDGNFPPTIAVPNETTGATTSSGTWDIVNYRNDPTNSEVPNSAIMGIAAEPPLQGTAGRQFVRHHHHHHQQQQVPFVRKMSIGDVDTSSSSDHPDDDIIGTMQRQQQQQQATSQGADASIDDPSAIVYHKDGDVPNLDELYIGGIDGLLKWSSSLEMD